MSRDAIRVRPTRADLTTAKAIARNTTPATEGVLRVATWLADEKVVMGAAAVLWTYTRLSAPNPRLMREADHLLVSVGLASMLPHVFKRLVARRRPDRTIPRRPRRGIPRSGNAWDSFPSGHAVHLGAVAPALLRVAPARFRPLVWPGIAVLAGTRIGLLAHYVTDVVAGLVVGLCLDKVGGVLSRPLRSRRERPAAQAVLPKRSSRA